jgi:hypothetical protein
MDLQGSGEVEATLLGLIKPAAADTAEVELAAADTDQVDSEQIDSEQFDTVSTGRQDEDTIELPPVVAAVSGGPQPVPQLPGQQSVDSAAADTAEVELAATDAERVDAERVDAERVDAERVDAERVDAERIDAEQVDAEQVDAEQVDAERVDAEQVDAEQVDAEQVDTAPAGPHDGDTVEIPNVQPAAAHIEKVETPIADSAAADTKNTAAEEADAQKAEIADVDAPGDTEPDTENDAIPRAETEKADREKGETATMLGTATAVPEPMAASPAAPGPIARPRRVRRGVVVAAVLLVLGCAVAVYQIVPGLLANGSRPSATASSAPTPVATTGAALPSGGSSASSDPKNGSAQGEAIRLDSVPESGRTFEAVRIRGTYRAGADTFLRVQRWDGGEWVDFPIPTKTDESGRFTAYVQLDQPGRNQLRMLHPGSGDTSKTFVIVVKG